MSVLASEQTRMGAQRRDPRQHQRRSQARTQFRSRSESLQHGSTGPFFPQHGPHSSSTEFEPHARQTRDFARNPRGYSPMRDWAGLILRVARSPCTLRSLATCAKPVPGPRSPQHPHFLSFVSLLAFSTSSSIICRFTQFMCEPLIFARSSTNKVDFRELCQWGCRCNRAQCGGSFCGHTVRN